MENTLYTGHTLDAEEIRVMLQYFDPTDFNTEKSYYETKNTYITELVETARVKYPNTKFNLVRSGFLKKLCDQTANYIVGDDVTITGLKNKPVLDINKYLQEMTINAAKNGRSWIHYYIQDDVLKYKLIPVNEIIPVYDNQYEDKLLYVIRFYKIMDGKDKRTRVEVWDDKTVTYYLEDLKTNTYFLDYLTTTEAQTPHIINVASIMGQKSETEGTSWGRPPFIELKYNYDRRSELWNVKDKIDAYDKVECGFMDNVDDVRDAILLIKDRGGQVLSEVKAKIDAYRALFVDETGDASYLTIEIPVEARKVLKDSLRASIYEFGNGVDMSAFKTGSNITNVYIQAMFQDLDSKCKGLSKHLDDFILEVLDFYNVYNSLSGRPVENLEEVEITYNKTIPSNKVEMIDAVNKSKGVISDMTIYETHPLVKDAEEEADRKDEELMSMNDTMMEGLGGAQDDPANTSNIQQTRESTNSSNQEDDPDE